MKFKINDPVRVIVRYSNYFDQVGTVTSTAFNRFHVSGLEDYPLMFQAEELILADYQPEETA
jgi:hypothetical protein